MRIWQKLRGESGIAMMTALMVSFVVLLLGTTTIALSMHSAESSAYDRKRVQAIAAAEAGLDYYFSHLSATGGMAPECSLSKSLPGGPASFQATAVFYDAAGGLLLCPLAPGITPAAVSIRSTGRAGTGEPARTMQAYARLTLTTGNTFDNGGAIFADSSLNLTANAQIGGSQYSDADVYSNGNVVLSANSIIYGRVLAQGEITVGSNSEARRDLWAKLEVRLRAGARARANVTSSTSNISMSGDARIYGDAKAAGSISGGTVSGASSPNTAGIPNPPLRSFPVFTYVSANWVASGYTERTYTDCGTALADITNWWGTTSGSYVVRVTGGCNMTFSTNVTIRGNIAVVTDGSITLSNSARFTPSGGPWNMFFFAGLSQQNGCQFKSDPHSGADHGLPTLIYVPATCTVTMHSNSAISEGQILGGVIDFKHTVSFRYSPLQVPGTGVGGFKQDILFRREIVA